MLHKVALFGITALIGGFVVGSAGVARAQTNVGNDFVTCNTLFGTASIKPALINNGTATTTAVKIKGTLAGCTDNTNGTVQLAGGTFSGKFAGTSNNCSTFVGTNPLTGPLTIKWKTTKTGPKITPTSTTVNVSTLTGGTFSPGGPFGTATYGTFVLGNSGASGAFTGGGSGNNATLSNIAVTSQDLGAILTGCGGAGVKSFNLGIGTITTTLVCGGFPPNTLPAGSYQGTCVECGVSGSVLSCVCAQSGVPVSFCPGAGCVSTSLDLANCPVGPDINNQNGVLTCAACIPPG
jgi:hypothetical protein